MAIRETIRSLETSPGRLQLFRQAFSRMMSLGDDRGYQWFASIHALPLPGWCEHGTYLFLPWHRAYLFYFELALQTRLGPRFTQRDPAEAAFADVAVPWWDWTSDESHRNGLPASYDAATVAGASNPLQSSGVASCQGGDRIALGVWSNALVSSLRNSNDPDPRTRRALRGLLTPTGDPRTRRDPDEPDELPRKNTIDNVVLQEPTFETFSDSLEQVHGDVHGWVGGSMSMVATAGYDPIFYSHHSMIDRIWYLWQISSLGVDPPAALLDTVLAPFPMTVRQTLSINLLGYDYAVRVSG